MRMLRTNFLFGLMVLLVAGCSTVVNSARQKQPMVECLVAGNAPGTLAIARKKHQSTANQGDELVWLLECGSLNFQLGNYAEALDDFRRCEELIEEYDERALVSVRDTGSEFLTLLANQNALPYRGWCRDRVALGFYKALAYLGNGDEAAFRAQVKRLRGEHQKIQEDYHKFFEEEEKQLESVRSDNAEVLEKASSTEYLEDERNAAYAANLQEVAAVAHRGYGNFLNPASLFLSGLALLRDETWDNACIEFEHLYQALPTSQTARQYYATALQKSGRTVPPELADVPAFPFPLGRDCVFVLYAHDLTASFEQVNVYFPLMIAWPICVFHPALLPNLSVVAEGKEYTAQTLSDMDGILAQEFSMRMPGRLTRTLAGALLKETGYLATVGAVRHNDKRKTSTSRRRTSATSALTGSATLAWKTYQLIFNTADTRCWNFLPKEIKLTQLPMPSDRLVTFCGELTGGSPQEVNIPEGCGSALIYVNALTPANVSYQVLPLK